METSRLDTTSNDNWYVQMKDRLKADAEIEKWLDQIESTLPPVPPAIDRRKTEVEFHPFRAS
jgi:hypothetical protein